MNNTIVISVMGRKGGITKTTVATNLAAGLALSGKSVLLIESDGQGNASQSVGLEPRDDFRSLIMDDAEFADVIREVPTAFIGKPANLSLLSAADGQRMVEEYKETPQIMYDRFKELRGVYDYVISDTSPGITQVHTGWYYASDYVLLPTTCEPDSVNSVSKTLMFLKQADEAGSAAGFPAAKVIGILPNRYTKAEKNSQFNLGMIHGLYGREYRVYEHIRDSVAWGAARRNGTSIYALNAGFDRRLAMAAKDARKEFARVIDSIRSAVPVEVA